MNKNDKEMDDIDEWAVNSSDSYSWDPDFDEYAEVTKDL